MQTVACIRWGSEYGADYVNRLHRAVMRNVARPTRFVAFTDPRRGARPRDRRPVDPRHPPAAGVEARAVAQARAMGGRPRGDCRATCSSLDLDILVTGSLDPLFEHEPGRLVLVRNPTQGRRDGIGNSSVMRFRAGSAPHLVADFEADRGGHLLPLRQRADLRHESLAAARRVLAGALVPELQARAPCRPGRCTSSVRRPCRPRPAWSSFTGHPRPDEAMTGRWPARWYKKFYRALPPVPWVAEHWR